MSTIQEQMKKLLDSYSEDVDNAVRDAAKKAAQDTAKTLKATSPRGAGKRHYASGWKVKRQEQGILVSYVVYNAAKPGLTHLLEKGHVSRNQFGQYGRVNGIRHIAPAEQEGIEIFENEVEDRIGRLK